MNTTMKNINAVKAKAMQSATLRKELKGWFFRDKRYTRTERCFGNWLGYIIDGVACGIHEDRLITVDNLFVGLKVQAIGDRFAVRYAAKAERDGYDTDINCYVEDGVVFASVYLSGKNAKGTKERAALMAAAFRKNGYFAETVVDEEDNRDYFVNAQIDFSLYVKNLNKKGN